MRGRRMHLLVLGLLVGALVMGTWSGEAKGPKPRRLRGEIAQLRAKVAQLESAVAFQQRRDAVAVLPGSKGICDDPCADDSDDYGIGDCQDSCPADQMNRCVDPCPLLDQDGDRIRDCTDPCPWGEATGMPCVVRKGDSGVARPRAVHRITVWSLGT